MTQQATRRRFSAADKLRILAEADACHQPGQLGALLRREGLNFGMKIEDVEGELRIVDQGTPPQAQVTEGEGELE